MSRGLGFILVPRAGFTAIRPSATAWLMIWRRNARALLALPGPCAVAVEPGIHVGRTDTVKSQPPECQEQLDSEKGIHDSACRRLPAVAVVGQPCVLHIVPEPENCGHGHRTRSGFGGIPDQLDREAFLAGVPAALQRHRAQRDEPGVVGSPLVEDVSPESGSPDAVAEAGGNRVLHRVVRLPGLRRMMPASARRIRRVMDEPPRQGPTRHHRRRHAPIRPQDGCTPGWFLDSCDRAGGRWSERFRLIEGPDSRSCAEGHAGECPAASTARRTRSARASFWRLRLFRKRSVRAPRSGGARPSRPSRRLVGTIPWLNRRSTILSGAA